MIKIYPETFFNIPHPITPLILIQFRVGKDIWEDIVFNPNNFFDSLTIEDNAGIKNLTLELFDKNYAVLEDKIMRMFEYTKSLNSIIKEENYNKTINFNLENSTHKLQYKRFSDSSNLRVRIGYTPRNNEKYIQEVKFDQNFYDRVNSEKPVIMSPWINFIITGYTQNISPQGLAISLKAVGNEENILNKEKILKQNARITPAAPKEVWRVLKVLVKEVSDSSIVFDDESDEPIAYKDELGNDKNIEILFGEAKDEGEINFKSIAALLDEFCNKVAPKNYNPDEEDTSDENIDAYKYTYSVYSDGEINKIKFYYPDPKSSVQKNIRMYEWIESNKTIIQDFTLETNMLFGALNTLGVYVNNNSGESRLFTLSQTAKGAIYLSNETTALASENNGTVTANTVLNYDSSLKDGLSPVVRYASVLRNLLTNGSMVIQGDPFFFFDKAMLAYIYQIEILIKRPSFLDSQGEKKGGDKSPLSGNYLVTKITHDFSSGKYITTLNLMKNILSEEEFEAKNNINVGKINFNVAGV